MERKPERTATRFRTVVKKIRCIRCPNEFTQASNYRRHLGLVHGVDEQGEPISSDIRQKYVNYSRKKNVRTRTERTEAPTERQYSQTTDLSAEYVECDQGDTTPLTAENVPNAYIQKRLRLKLPDVRPFHLPNTNEFDRDYKRLQRPIDDIVKTGQSLQLFDMLHDQSIIDNQKVRECVAALYKYVNMRKEVPAELDVQSNFTTSTPACMRKPSPSTARRHRRRCQAWTLY